MTFQLVRQFSTNQQLLQRVQIPCQVFGVEGRYATALYSASVKLKKLDEVEKDMKILKGTLMKNSKFVDFLHDPIARKMDKTNSLKKILSKLNFSEPMVRVMEIMSMNGQLKLTDSFVVSLGMLFDSHKGIVKCVITSAKPLDTTSEKELVATLQLLVDKGQKIEIEKKIDEHIIGGLTISIGDKFVDMSVARKIRTYRTLMESAI